MTADPAPSLPAGAAGRRAALLADAAAGVLVLGYAALKAYALSPAFSDENIYFYMCHRMTEGALPYRDFFFAHPPFHLLPGFLLMSAVGFTVPSAKAIPALAAALAGIAIYRAARRAGAPAALVALVLFLFSYDLLRASSHYTGASEATAFIAWALERALAGRPRAAGLLAGSAGLTAFYAIPAAGALLVWIGLRERRAALSYALAFGALFGGVNLLCLGIFQESYWGPVFRYHFMKPPGGEGNLATVLRGLTRENAWLLWSAPAAAAALSLMRGGGDRLPVPGRGPRAIGSALLDARWAPAVAGLLTATLHLAFFSLLTRVFTFYALPALPALALAGGIAYVRSLRAVALPFTPIGRRSGTVPRAGRGSPDRRTLGAVAGLAALAMPLLLPAWLPVRGVDADEGEVLRRYSWRDAPLPEWMNGVVRGLLWRDERVAGAWTPSPTRYLWHESRSFTAPAALAEKLRELTPAEGTIFGDSTATPLVALLAGRRITLDQADTNAMRYRSRITPPEEAIAELERDPPSAIVANARRGFFLVNEMRAWVTSRYRVAASVNDPIYGRYDLYLPAGP